MSHATCPQWLEGPAPAVLGLVLTASVVSSGSPPADPPAPAENSAATPAANWTRVRAGLTEGDLKALLGEPTGSLGPADFKILQYPDGEVFLKDGSVVDWTKRAPAVARAPAAAPASPGETRSSVGLPKFKFTDYVRAYEPNEGGETWDRHNDPFLDFTFSIMLPAPFTSLGSEPDPTGPGSTKVFYPPVFRPPGTENDFERSLAYAQRPGVYFAMTAREGFYWLGSRYSGPVMSKRMNPLLSVRWWAKDGTGEIESDDNFLEVVYGHESNGQFIDTLSAFNAQVATYLDQPTSNPTVDPSTAAYREARDNISRGWDYIGVQFSRDWNTALEQNQYWTFNLRAKYNYFLTDGLLQGTAEEYRSWEDDPDGKPRKYVDGISLRLTGRHHEPPSGAGATNLWAALLGDRFALNLSTGYVQPGRFTTVKVEAGVPLLKLVPGIKDLPTLLWYRYGYATNLVDYYKKTQSFGIKISMWKFTTGD